MSEPLTKEEWERVRVLAEAILRASPSGAPPWGPWMLSLLADLERVESSMLNHFQEEHLAGDGPEIDRWKARLDRVVDALEWYDTATRNPFPWCPNKDGFFEPKYNSDDVTCGGCGKWFPVREGVHEDAEVDHFFTLVRAAAKGEP